MLLREVSWTYPCVQPDLKMFTPFVHAFVRSHLKCPAHPRTIFVDSAQHRHTIQRCTPAIVPTHHGFTAPSISFYVPVRDTCICQKDDFQTTAACFAAGTTEVGSVRYFFYFNSHRASACIVQGLAGVQSRIVRQYQCQSTCCAHSPSSRFTCAGCSTGAKWPASSITASSLFGISRHISLCWATGLQIS